MKGVAHRRRINHFKNITFARGQEETNDVNINNPIEIGNNLHTLKNSMKQEGELLIEKMRVSKIQEKSPPDLF